MLSPKRRFISIESQETQIPKNVNETVDTLQQFANIDASIRFDATYLPLVVYLIRHKEESCIRELDLKKEEAKAVRECTNKKFYVKHAKYPKIGLQLTFPISILEDIFSHLPNKEFKQ